MKLIAKTTFDIKTIKSFTNDCGYCDVMNLNELNEFTFITLIPNSLLITMVFNLDLDIKIVTQDLGEFTLCTLKGSLVDWQRDISKVFATKLNKNIQLNKLMEIAFNYFKQVEKLDILWDNFEKRRSTIGLLEFKEK